MKLPQPYFCSKCGTAHHGLRHASNGRFVCGGCGDVLLDDSDTYEVYQLALVDLINDLAKCHPKLDQSTGALGDTRKALAIIREQVTRLQEMPQLDPKDRPWPNGRDYLPEPDEPLEGEASGWWDVPEACQENS